MYTRISLFNNLSTYEMDIILIPNLRIVGPALAVEVSEYVSL